MDGRGAQSVPYGQACLSCFKSKCRCISRSDGEGCERCHRLNKRCQPSHSIRKRNGNGQGQGSSARMAQLEGKLDSVVSLLQSVANTPDSSAALRRLLDLGPGNDAATPSSLSPPEGVAVPPSVASPPLTSPSCSPASVNAPGDNNARSSLCELSHDEIERYLADFRTHMLPNLPFVHLTSDQTVEQLHNERPFFLRSIIAVSSTSIQHKTERGRELKTILAQEFLVENRSSLDLLLGILTYIAWGSDQFLTKSDTISRLMMMAMSIVYDLGLNKPIPADEHMIGSYVPEFPCPLRVTRQETGQALVDGQRAALACFLLSSIVSSYFSQIDAMRWTPRMEENLCVIAANKDCCTDEAFSFLVRLQRLAQETVRAREQIDGTPAGGETSPPLFLFLGAMQKQLHDLRKSIPLDLQSHDMLILHTHYIELCITETVHTANSNSPVLPHLSTGTSFERLDSLWRSVNSIKSWLDTFFSLPPATCRGLSFPFWAQMARCLVTLIRLSLLEDPSWDRQAVRNTIDIRIVLDRMAETMELACREAADKVDDDLFAQFPRMARILMAWIGTKMVPEEPEGHGEWPYFVGDAIGMDKTMPWMMDVGNDEWLSAFLAGRISV